MSMRFSVESCADPIHDRADQCEQLTRERDELRQMVFDLFAQGCGRASITKGWLDPKYDHRCISTYEDVQAKLIEWGMVKREECVRNG